MTGGAGRSACAVRGIVHESRSHPRGAAAFMVAITAGLRDSASCRSAAARLLRLSVALLAPAAGSESRPAHADDGYAAPAARAEPQRRLAGATPPLSERMDRDGTVVAAPFGLPISTHKR